MGTIPLSPLLEGTQGQSHVSLPWLQCTYYDYIENTGKDGIGYGKIVKRRIKKR
jgi:hypothetical protein